MYMKKNFLKTICSLMLSALLISGCQKQILEKDEAPGVDEQGLQASRGENDGDNNSCQLKHLDYGTGYTLDFKYNNKGLASEVLLSYSDGYFERHEIGYDRRGMLVKTKITSLDLPVILYDFSNSGGFITRANGYFEGTNEPWRDIRYTYNRQGQMTKLDDIVQDIHLKYFYNRQGYNTHGDIYFGNELYLSYDYGFNRPNRNPFLAVPGVPFGFWDLTLPLWDKRWEDYDRITIYENGSPIVTLETDASQTRMTTEPHNYLTSATKFDIISESFYTESMTYQNCRGRNDDLSAPPSNSKTAIGMSAITRVKKIINGHSKNMKQELQALKSEILNKNKAK
jgi:hypothetical protein